MGARTGYIADVLACLVGAVVLLCAATLAQATEGKPLRGVALIIGNGAYEHLAPLTNPPDDARAVEDLFDELGFETFDARDADARKLRRVIERFVEDAEGADVAVLYYAGHGIEAGGENYLVPTDADLSALENAGEKLVPLTDLLAELRAAAPMTIILLDACRDNPFPAGSIVRPAPGADPVPLGAGGLGETRGVSRFGQTSGAGAADAANLGALIGFAAEPGKVALDGDAGANSPYAAAVLRHISAMTGEEFGTVMRMVAEEVYLKTGGRQRPWVNESLRRLLYFGSAPDPVEGAEGDILRERRQLLVTIAALPDIERRQVEAVARDASVPMDAVYGMLRALGEEAPKDPAELERLLRQQTAKIAEMRRERAVVAGSDPEILRLSELAALAISEGALETAIGLHEQAKARVHEIEKTVETVEADIKARRMEFADVFARSGETSFMAFDYEQSARDYQAAFEQVERWDDWAAWSHRGNQAVALQASGWRGGKTDHLREAAVLAREIVQRAERLPDRADWATSQTFLGNTLVTLGQRDNNPAMLREAAAAYEAALTVYAEGSGFDAQRIDVLHNLAGALFQVGAKGNDETVLRTAIDRFAELARMVPRTEDPQVWARTVSVQASAMTDLARSRGDARLFEEAISLHRQALEVRQREILPEQWAETAHRMAVAMSDLGTLRNDAGLMRQADELFLSVLPVLDRGKSPVTWSDALQNAGLNAHSLAIESGDTTGLERAVGFYRQALEVRSRDSLPDLWADTQTSMAGALCDLGRLRRDVRLIEEGIAAHRLAAEILTRETVPGEWSRIQSNIGDALRIAGDIEGSLGRIADSVEVQAGALAVAVASGEAVRAENARERIVASVLSAARIAAPDDPVLMATLDRAASLLSDRASPGALASVDSAIGRALYARAVSASDPALFEQSIAAYRRALVAEARAEPYRIWANTQSNLGLALRELARLPGHENLRAEAIEAWRAAQAEETDDTLWIGNQRALATLLDELGAAGDVARLREAADAWGALAKRLPETDRPGRASAAESRGVALQNAAYYAPGGDETAIDDAITAYRTALSDLDARGSPDDWRRIAGNLAELQLARGQSRNDTAALGEAADLFRALAAAPAGAREAGELDRIRIKLASALSARATMAGDTAVLREAIEIFRGVFEVDPSVIGRDWQSAVTFAQALRTLGQTAGEAAPLEESARLLAAVGQLPPTALDEQNRAFVRFAEGDTLLVLGDLAGQTDMLRRAVAAYREADAFYTQDAFPAYWRQARTALANALLTFGTAAKDSGPLSEAVVFFRALLAATSREAETAMWAGSANGLAWGLTQLARLGDGTADPEEAARYAGDAHAAFRALSSPVEAAQAQDTLCGAITELGRKRRDPALAEQALAACDAALTVFRENKLATLVRYGEESRARAAALHAELVR